MTTRSYSRRRQGARWALVYMAGVAVIIIGVFLGRHGSRQPELYKPGTVDTGVTRALSTKAPLKAPRPHFKDVTSEAGLSGFRTFAGGRSSQLPEDMGAGAAWGDYDLDGDKDLFLVAVGGTLGLSKSRLAPCRLYENQGDRDIRRCRALPGCPLSRHGGRLGGL